MHIFHRHYLDRLTIKNVSYLSFLILVAILSTLIVKPYFHTIVFAGVWAIALQPLYKIFLMIYGETHKKTSLISTIATFFAGIAVVLSIVVWALMSSVEGYNWASLQTINPIEILPEYIQQANELPLTKTIFGEIQFSEDIETYVRGGLNQISQSILGSLYSIVNNSAAFIIHFFIWLFFLIWFIEQGAVIKKHVFKFSPLDDTLDEELWKKSRTMIESIMLGSVVISLVQGFVGGIFLVLFHVPNAFALTVLMMLLGVIPYIGGSFIMFISALVLAIQGQFISSLGLLTATILVVTNIDNILRPKLVKKEVSLPESLMFVGIVGGVTQFGVLGLIYGPLILLWLKICLSKVKS